MKALRLILFASLGCGLLSAQPFVYYRGILNAGSTSPAGLPNGSIARGSIFSIYGRDMGPAQGAQPSQFPLGTKLQGVEIKVCRAQECLNAIPLFVRADQINAVMPSNAPLGPLSVQVSFNDAPSNFSPVVVVENSVGLLAISGQGFGPGVIQNFNAVDNQPLNSLVTSARPGQVVIAWATGLGAALNADNVPPTVGDPPVQVEIFVGGVKATNKLYSGRSSQFAGVDQIIFEIPANAPTGCYVPVQVRAGAVVSNTVTMAIQAEGQECNDPHNLALTSFRQGGRLGAIFLSRFDHQHRYENGHAVDMIVDQAAVTFREESGGQWAFSRVFSLPPVGSCHAYSGTGNVLRGDPLPGTAPSVRPLDAGAQLTITSGAGNLPIPRSKNQTSFYTKVLGRDSELDEAPARFFNDSGESRVAIAGGADVSAFEVSVASAAPPRWINRDQAATVSRSQGLEVRWEAAANYETVAIAGGAVDVPTNASGYFYCLAPAQPGRFVVPAEVLANLPATRGKPEQSFARVWISGGPAARLEQGATGGLDLLMTEFEAATSRVIRLE